MSITTLVIPLSEGGQANCVCVCVSVCGETSEGDATFLVRYGIRVHTIR